MIRGARCSGRSAPDAAVSPGAVPRPLVVERSSDMTRIHVCQSSRGRLLAARRCAGVGLVAVATVLMPWIGHADDRWADGRHFTLLDSAAESSVPPPSAAQAIAALSPGSVVIAQAGAAPSQGKDW